MLLAALAMLGGLRFLDAGESAVPGRGGLGPALLAAAVGPQPARPAAALIPNGEGNGASRASFEGGRPAFERGLEESAGLLSRSSPDGGFVRVSPVLAPFGPAGDVAVDRPSVSGDWVRDAGSPAPEPAAAAASVCAAALRTPSALHVRF